MSPVCINSIGLSFDIAGAITIWWFIPDLFEEDENGDIMPTDIGEKKRKLTLSRVGIILIVIGFIIQLISGISR